MSNLGLNDITPEMQASKDLLSSKDAQIETSKNQLLKQAAAFQELKNTLNETLHKLGEETARVMQLENTSKQLTNDLRNAKVSSANLQTELFSAQAETKAKDSEARGLQSIIDKLSYSSDDASTRILKLEREKSTLDARVKDLQREITGNAPPITPGRPLRQQQRSPSPSDSKLQIDTLRKELDDTRKSAASKEAESHVATQKLERLQLELVRVNNEKMTNEKNFVSKLAKAESAAEDTLQELQFFRQQSQNGNREEELLERIDDDEKKIAMLEGLLAETANTRELETKLARVEQKLRVEMEKSAANNARNVELVCEKEEALDELSNLQAKLKEAQAELASQTISAADSTLNQAQFDNGMLDPYPRQSTPILRAEPNEEAVDYIERLLAATTRLRIERDGLRRDLQFLETEHKFTVDALDAKTSFDASNHDCDYAKLVSQMKVEQSALRVQLQDLSAIPRRLGLALAASTIVINHFRSNNDALLADAHSSLERSQQVQHDMELKLAEVESKLADSLQQLQEAAKGTVNIQLIENLKSELSATQDRLSETTESLQESRAEREALTHQLHALETGKASQDPSYADLQSKLTETETNLTTLTRTLQSLESERDSLSLQATNLTTDLSKAQSDLIAAEDRYTTLQTQSLSTMSDHEASRVLRTQIANLEARVQRRTEQIGMHQHDIKRLETNLRLQDERVEEMTVEIEMAMAEKEAMVEDCAEARESRDEAVRKTEALEVSIEALEGKLNEREAELQVLVATIFEAKDNLRRRPSSFIEVKETDARFEDLRVTIQALESENKGLRQDMRDSVLAFATCQLSAITGKRALCAARDLKSQLEVQITSITQQLDARTDDVERLQQDLTNDLDERIQQQTTRHTEEITSLQKQLKDATLELDNVNSRYDSERDQHRKALEEAETLKTNIENRLNVISETLDASEKTTQDLSRQIQGRDSEISDLQRSLTETKCEMDALLLSRQELEETHTRVIEDLEAKQESAELRLAEVTQQAEAAQRELKDNIDDLTTRLSDAESNYESLQSEFEQKSHELQSEIDARVKQEESHLNEIFELNERHGSAEQDKSLLEQDLKELQEKLDDASDSLVSIRKERDHLKNENKHLEVEYQRSISLSKSLENQVKESQRTLASVNEELAREQVKVAESEKASHTAIADISFKTLEHQREVSALRREITTLQNRPNLDAVVVELEERNNEMEEILKVKCAEIENNDDRVMEYLKEKKKLTTKVETLTRKVQNLQTKLAVAKAAAPAQPAALEDVIPPVPPIPLTFTRPRSATSSSTHSEQSNSSTTPLTTARTTQRMVSGPSSLPRSKTPERKVAPPPVFKARTPERVLPPMDNNNTQTSNSKKRRSPDDFDEVIVPRQAFTVDSLPGPEDNNSLTPRPRRPLGNVRGFTPVRHNNTSAALPIVSPKRASSSATASRPLAQDMTNSPRAVSHPVPPKSNRSWLGKMRAASTTAAPRADYLFESRRNLDNA